MTQSAERWQDNPVLSGVYAYWRSKCTGLTLPRRVDIDPTEMAPELLPHIMLTELVEQDGRRRFRFRLAGTAMKEGVGLDLTGKFVDELNPNKEYAAYVEGLYTMAIETRRPIYSRSKAIGSRINTFRMTSRMMCPLSRDGERVDMFLTAQTLQAFGERDAPTLTDAADFKLGPTEVVPA